MGEWRGGVVGGGGGGWGVGGRGGGGWWGGWGGGGGVGGGGGGGSSSDSTKVKRVVSKTGVKEPVCEANVCVLKAVMSSVAPHHGIPVKREGANG